MGRLSKAAIVAMALDLVGNSNPKFQIIVEGWLDLILDDVARNFRFPDLEKRHIAPIAAGADTLAYPSDYAFLVKDRTSRAEGVFVQSDGSRSLIYLASLGATRDHPDHTATAGGVPSQVADDPENQQWILHPVVSPAGTVKLNYQSIPANVASAAVPWFPDDEAMVEAVTFLAERRQRGGQTQLAKDLKEATLRLARASPNRAQLWQGGSGSGLGPRIFR